MASDYKIIRLVCPKCRQTTDWYERDPKCRNCGHLISAQDARVEPPRIDEEIAAAEKAGDYAALSTAAIEHLSQRMLVTTETVVSDHIIEKRLGIITSECVFGMNVFRDFFASATDFFGGRSVATQKVLRDCRNTCLAELKREALMLGANGIVAVDLDYGELSGGGKLGMVLLVASGTAVRQRLMGGSSA